MYNNSIQLFYDQYGCLPGDCNAIQISSISPQAALACANNQGNQYNVTQSLGANCSSNNSQSMNINFPNSYSSITPNISVNSCGNGIDTFTCSIQNITGSGFTINLVRTDINWGWCAVVSINYSISTGAIIDPTCCKPITSATALANTANTEIYNMFGTGAIESTTKRSCMFQELQAAGFINGKIKSNNPLTDSIAGGTIPVSVVNSKMAWDYRKSSGLEASVNRFPLPFELGYYTNLVNYWTGRHMFILRDANIINGLNLDITGASGQITGGANYAISSNLTQKLDSKFDDGLPYGGNIVGGLTISSWHATPNISCNTFSGSGSTTSSGNITNNTYLSSNDISKGCLVAFLVSAIT